MIFHSCVNLPEGTMAYGNTQQVPPIWVEVHVPSTPSRPMEVMLALDRSCFAFVIMVNGPRYAAENQVPAADLSNANAINHHILMVYTTYKNGDFGDG